MTSSSWALAALKPWILRLKFFCSARVMHSSRVRAGTPGVGTGAAVAVAAGAGSGAWAGRRVRAARLSVSRRARAVKRDMMERAWRGVKVRTRSVSKSYGVSNRGRRPRFAARGGGPSRPETCRRGQKFRRERNSRRKELPAHRGIGRKGRTGRWRLTASHGNFHRPPVSNRGELKRSGRGGGGGGGGGGRGGAGCRR